MSDPITNLYAVARRTLAGSETFQNWCGAASEEEALESIFVVGTSPDTPKPYAVVDRLDIETSERGFYDEGSLFVGIWGEPVGDAEAAILAQDVIIGKIVEEMQALAGVPGYMDARKITLGVSTRASLEEEEIEPDSAQDHVQTVLTITW